MLKIFNIFNNQKIIIHNQNMFYFIKLIRPINIAIIFLTMYALRLFYTSLPDTSVETNLGEQIDFFLLVVSTLLIAAGGNIINDYFDVKADRINKPKKLIISKYIKPRWAILSHWFLNGIALIIATYLSIKYLSFSFVFIHLVSINALWFYSVYFKRKAFIGNLIVSILTALVPIICGVYFHFTGLNQPLSLPNFWINFLHEDYRLIFGMAIFAFLLNLAREIVKDIQDVKGDLELHAKTLPIVFGRKAAKWSTGLILLSIPSVSVLMYLPHEQALNDDILLFFPFVVALLLVSISLLLIIQTNHIKTVDRLLKIAMFLGLILPLYWLIY